MRKIRTERQKQASAHNYLIFKLIKGKNIMKEAVSQQSVTVHSKKLFEEIEEKIEELRESMHFRANY